MVVQLKVVSEKAGGSCSWEKCNAGKDELTSSFIMRERMDFREDEGHVRPHWLRVGSSPEVSDRYSAPANEWYELRR